MEQLASLLGGLEGFLDRPLRPGQRVFRCSELDRELLISKTAECLVQWAAYPTRYETETQNREPTLRAH